MSGGGGQVPGDVVARAKAALEGVTPGPWEVVADHDHMTGETSYHLPHIERYREYRNSVFVGTDMALAEFIASARSLIPELVAEIERLRYDADHFTKQLQDSLDPGGGDEWDADDVIAIVRDLEADVERLRERLDAEGESDE